MVSINKTRKFAVIDTLKVYGGSSDISAKNSAYEMIFKDIEYLDAARESRAEREAIGRVKDVTLTYGEVRFDGINKAFDVIKNDGGLQTHGGSFCDLGSGSGHGCIIAALYQLYHDFESCYGIELVKCLYDMSLCAKRNWEVLYHFSHTTIEFYHDTFLDLSMCVWTKCNIIFANSTCFTVSLINQIADLASKATLLFIVLFNFVAEAMRMGSYFITFTTQLPVESGFQVISELREEMSW